MLKNKIYILLLFPVFVFSQLNTMSPYSFYGVGDLNVTGLTQNIFMGGLSNALSDPYHLNFNNPSSYSSLDWTSAELAFGVTYNKMQQNELENSDVTSNIIGFGMGFPISKNGGIGIGFRPYSSMGYDIEYTSEQDINEENVGILKHNFFGNGGLNQAIFGASYKLFDLVSVGFNLNYYFGTLSRVNSIEFDSTGFYNYREISSLIVRDFQFEYGMMVNYKIKDNMLSFGLVFSPASSIRSKQTQFAYTYTLSGDFETFEQIIYNSEESKGDITLPMFLNTGFNFSKADNWLIGLDYNYTKWSGYTLFNSPTNYLENINEVIIGGYFIPKPEDIHNYWNKVQYRFGLSYLSGYLNLDAIQNLENVDAGLLNEYKISMGVGLPIPKNKSQVNLGMEFGGRGTKENLLVQENYIRLIFSMTFNDKWFKKRKIE